MKCIDKKVLLRYLKGELNHDRREEVKQHLESCDKCRGFVEGFSQTFNALDYLPAPEPAPRFSARVMSEITKIEQEGFWQRLILPAAISVAAAVSIFFGIFVGHNLYAVMQEQEGDNDTVDRVVQTTNFQYQDPSVYIFLRDQGDI